MGYESAFAARRRLANAMTARADSLVLPVGMSATALAELTHSAPVSMDCELDRLAGDILDTPGAGGALLAAFAAQSRALSLVAEAAMRSPDAPLPAEVLRRVQDAINAAPMTAVA